MDIRPHPSNPRYWSLHGKATLLLGGSCEDNLFQISDLIGELDRIAGAGGNVVRNTMSDRDPGDARAFLALEDGRYDLCQWNPVYWEKFETLLRETARRDIAVQIEVWDRFDHSRDPWRSDPWNPVNNINYDAKTSGLASDYPEHPGKNLQPFFFSVPALHDNRVLLPFQEAFVRKLLSHSLAYGHVLYCMDNETEADPAWGAYWASFIRRVAAEAGRQVYLTEMWDPWVSSHPLHRNTLDHPERYDFIDLSQNSQLTGEENWRNAQFVRDHTTDRPRPINSTKIYGNDAYPPAVDKGKGTAHAIACFWRNVLGGFASSRFHRPAHGLGSGETALLQIRIAREVLRRYDLFRGQPDGQFRFFAERATNAAYLNWIPGEAALVFFPQGGEVVLDAPGWPQPGFLTWYDLLNGEQAVTRPASTSCALACPRAGRPWLAHVYSAHARQS